MKKRLMLTLIFLTLPLLAIGNEIELDRTKIPTDRASVLRGAEHVVNSCVSCHALKYIKYSDMLALGVQQATIDAWRTSNPISARIMAQMPPEAAAAAFGGIVPPDLSLMAIARDGGVHYLYSYLMGYQAKENEPNNKIYPGTRMPDMLGISTATETKARAEIGTKAQEITAFLSWAADPHAEERKQLGYYVIGYLLILTTLLYFWKVQIWRKVG